MLVPPLYRAILKKAIAANKHYKSVDDTLRSVFGLMFPIDHRCCLPLLSPTARKRSSAQAAGAEDQRQQQQQQLVRVVRWFFTGVPCLTAEVNERLQGAFDALRRLDIALPNSSEDNGSKYFAGRATLTHLPNHFPSVIRNVKPRTMIARDGHAMPLPRHGFPSEPFYIMNVSSESQKCLFLRHMIDAHLRDSSVVSMIVDDEATVPSEAAPNLPPFRSKKTAVEQETDLRASFRKFSTCTVTTNREHNFEVVCRTRYAGLENETSGGDSRYLFKYDITLRNRNPKPPSNNSDENSGGSAVGGKTFLLLSRHWNFVDAASKTMTEFVGPGVVGEFPTVGPEEEYSYSSGTSLDGSYGAMCGAFQLVVFPTGFPEAMQSTLGSQKSKKKANTEEQHLQNMLDLHTEQIDVRIGMTALRSL